MKWKDLVFMEVVNYCNDIGSRTFSLKDFLDAKLQLFTKSKPQNQHVEAKIRQQLQFLRDEQKITFLDNSGHYTLRDIYLRQSRREDAVTAPKTVRSFLAKAGAKGGKAKTPAKARASRENGKKGGRPRKVQKRPDIDGWHKPQDELAEHA